MYPNYVETLLENMADILALRTLTPLLAPWNLVNLLNSSEVKYVSLECKVSNQ